LGGGGEAGAPIGLGAFMAEATMRRRL